MGKDIILDKDGDLKIEDGDFVIGNSDQQEIEALIMWKKGECKEFPLAGGNLAQLLKTREGQTAALREAKYQLNNDGFDINKIGIENFNINIDADRI